MRIWKKALALVCCVALVAGMAACGNDENPAQKTARNGEIYVIATGDIHCGIDEGFGLAGVAQIRNQLEAEGYDTILVDTGDAVQGELVGTLSQGTAIIDLMNATGYDVAIPGNHEFAYGVENFMALTGQAKFPYISCNFTYHDELVFDPYIIKEVGGRKIGFVGVTTPETIIKSTPSNFQDENGNFIFGFMRDETGEKLYAAVQEAIDGAKAEGAEYIYLLGHMGMDEESIPWTYKDVIEHTRGIDAFFDAHSHDTDEVHVADLDGNEVTRVSMGARMNCIGYSHISAEGEILDTGVWSWPNDISAQELLGIHNDVSEKVDAALAAVSNALDEEVAETKVNLVVNDPTQTDETGNPLRVVRLRETNLGDLCADAYRDQTGADVAVVNGGGIRVGIDKGDITSGEIIQVHPFGNRICVVEVTGQQLLDALEWGARSVPRESGAFLQVSGLTYEIHTGVVSSCVGDENGMFAGITGPRRVQNVMVGGKPLDPAGTYTLASHNYMLEDKGDGYSMFEGCRMVQDGSKLDNQVLIDYIKNTLGGVIGAEYANPNGQGRIVITE